MKEDILLLEVGSEALDELTDKEKNLILCKFLDSQIKLAGMFVFNLLRKKYRPSYRMGSMYENDSAKFEKYNELFKEYAQSVSAGKLAVETNTQTTYEIERYKWPEQTRQ